MSTIVQVRSGWVRNLLKDSITTDTGGWQFKDAPKTAIQASVVGTGAISATVVIEASNDGVYAIGTPIGTITLTGTTSAADGFTTDAPWKYVRARVTSVSGTGATINVIMSV